MTRMLAPSPSLSPAPAPSSSPSTALPSACGRSPPAPPTTPVQLSPPTDAAAEGVTASGDVRDGCGVNRVPQRPSASRSRRRRHRAGRRLKLHPVGLSKALRTQQTVAAGTGIEGGAETLEVNSGAPVGRTADRRMGRAAAAAAAGAEAALPRPEFTFGEPRSLCSRRRSSMAVVPWMLMPPLIAAAAAAAGTAITGRTCCPRRGRRAAWCIRQSYDTAAVAVAGEVAKSPKRLTAGGDGTSSLYGGARAATAAAPSAADRATWALQGGGDSRLNDVRGVLRDGKDGIGAGCRDVREPEPERVSLSPGLRLRLRQDLGTEAAAAAEARGGGDDEGSEKGITLGGGDRGDGDDEDDGGSGGAEEEVEPSAEAPAAAAAAAAATTASAAATAPTTPASAFRSGNQSGRSLGGAGKGNKFREKYGTKAAAMGLCTAPDRSSRPAQTAPATLRAQMHAAAVLAAAAAATPALACCQPSSREARVASAATALRRRDFGCYGSGSGGGGLASGGSLSEGAFASGMIVLGGSGDSAEMSKLPPVSEIPMPYSMLGTYGSGVSSMRGRLVCPVVEEDGEGEGEEAGDAPPPPPPPLASQQQRHKTTPQQTRSGSSGGGGSGGSGGSGAAANVTVPQFGSSLSWSSTPGDPGVSEPGNAEAAVAAEASAAVAHMAVELRSGMKGLRGSPSHTASTAAAYEPRMPAAEQRQQTPPSPSPSPPPPPPRSASPFRGSPSRDDFSRRAAVRTGAPFSMWSGAAVSTLSAFSQTLPSACGRSPPAPPTTPVQLSPPTDAAAEGVTASGDVRDGCGVNRVPQRPSDIAEPPPPPSGRAPVEAPPRGLVEGLAHPANVSGVGGDSITSRRTTDGVTALDADAVPQIPSTGSGVAAGTGIEGGAETLEVNSGAPVGRTADRRMGRAAAAAAAGAEAALPRPEFTFGEPRSLCSRRRSSMAVVVAAGAGSDTSNATATAPPAVHLQYDNFPGFVTAGRLKTRCMFLRNARCTIAHGQSTIVTSRFKRMIMTEAPPLVH
ncbi:hypothetical protein VOLCADRAFT_87518 [Volvox carteri f. nagariensis]|uniref:Uncharacterized protein n=1 Tax=Volvox carteri f. nagariensis TaxID=3068 RepID=D8TLI5_VOLCA|nr:uncharacterized protein VOLCADRAFT_87518 [Volvox carteri f. nagariensis]EFJ51880.1 hypothetical protein VOLCADRAFT_87518 [Volvox carteri f. nagariensis]|eukprot:XP_002947290.1 hypothetical protein VOLCADRAFT_87518 [Volvox carteri f. nagariensis]